MSDRRMAKFGGTPSIITAQVAARAVSVPLLSRFQFATLSLTSLPSIGWTICSKKWAYHIFKEGCGQYLPVTACWKSRNSSWQVFPFDVILESTHSNPI